MHEFGFSFCMEFYQMCTDYRSRKLDFKNTQLGSASLACRWCVIDSFQDLCRETVQKPLQRRDTPCIKLNERMAERWKART